MALLLSACPRERATPQPTPTPGGAPAGVARVAIADEPPTLNPLTTLGLSFETRALLPLLTPVIGGSATGPGRVAATFDRSSTAVTVAPGSVWSDGTPIGPGDIERTWRLVRAAGVPFAGYDEITDVRVEGATVRITAPDAMGVYAGGFRVLPPDFDAATYADAWPTSGGPFVLSGRTSGLSLSFAANPRAPGGAPILAGLELMIVTDPDAALALFRRDEIDVLTRYGAPGWHERLVAAGAKVSESGEGHPVALVLRAPATSAARRRMLARIDVARMTSVLVQQEAEYSCTTREPPVCDRNAEPGDAGSPVGTLALAYSASDHLAHDVAVALRQMIGPVRLQHRTAADLWGNLDEIDLAILTGLERDDLGALVEAGTGPEPRVHALFVARGSLAARVELGAPGRGGPFDGAGAWPTAVAGS